MMGRPGDGSVLLVEYDEALGKEVVHKIISFLTKTD